MTKRLTEPTHHKVTVIGGGLTGKMMALALSYSGYEIVLIAPNAAMDGAGNTPIDRRSTTIHNAGAKMLSALGLIDRLTGKMAPIDQIKVSIGDARPYHSDWLLNWSSQPLTMAYVVENHQLDNALDEAIAEAPHPITLVDDSITAYHDAADSATLELASGAVMTSDLVIACDGVKSPLRALAGITPKIEETGQRALIATLDAEIGHDDTAYQRFLATGPIALMPLAGKQVSLVWSTGEAQAQALMAQDDDALSEAITNAFGDELGKLTLAGPRGAFPLRPHFNRRLSKGRLILAGDAAHAIHPLAGMGYNLALADAAILLAILQDTKAKGLCANHPSVMAAYQRRRMPEILALSALTSQLNRLLSRPKTPLSSLINMGAAMGMSMIDKTPLKKQLCDVAMGGKLSSAPLLKGHID